MTDEELFDILRPIVMQATSVPECILADPNIPAPFGEYAAMRMTGSATGRGQPIVYRTNAGARNVSVDVREQAVVEVQIQFYRGEALHYARRLRGANKRPSISQTLFKSPVRWRRTGPVNNLTALEEDSQEQRAAISLYVMFEEIDPGTTETINAIEKVPYSIAEYADGSFPELASGVIE